VDCQSPLTADIDAASLCLSACAVYFLPLPLLLSGPPLPPPPASPPAAALRRLYFPRPCAAGIFFDNIETSAEQCTTERSVTSRS